MSKFESLTVKELKDICRENDIKGYSNKKRNELIEMLNSIFNNVDIKKRHLKLNLKFIDLFCGIGGFHQAMNKLEIKCVFACDIDKQCRKIYRKNYNIKPKGDIREVDTDDIPNFDILCAGFPCQSFSNAGKKKSFDDERGTLFNEIIRIANDKKPMFMFLENVKHIKKIDNGRVFKYINDEIENIGYIVEHFILSPHQFGIPQQRERIFFVCIRNDIYDENIKITIPLSLNNKTSFDTITSISDEEKEKYKIDDDTHKVLRIWDKMIKKFDVGEKLSPTILCHEFYREYDNKEFQELPSWKQDYIMKNKRLYNKYKKQWDKWYIKYGDFLSKKEIYGKLEWQVGKKKENDSIFNYIIQFRQSGIRVKKTNYFPTLVAIVQTPIIGKEKRYITPRECARLQSFSDNFILHSEDKIAFKQLGNSVNVDVVFNVIYNTLYNYRRILRKLY